MTALIAALIVAGLASIVAVALLHHRLERWYDEGEWG